MNICDKCGGTLFATIHSCPSRWLAYEPDSGDETDAVQVYGHDAEEAAQNFWEWRCANEAEYTSGKCSVKLETGDTWQSFHIEVETVTTYSATATPEDE